MSLEDTLRTRSGSVCELCGAGEALEVLDVPSGPGRGLECSALVCPTCSGQLTCPAEADPNHWRCLSTSMWSEIPAVQVLAWRMLTHLNHEAWARDLLEQLYLEDAVLAWATAGVDAAAGGVGVRHVDSNGVELAVGDTVTLIKDLVVKGAGFTAKRGTAVRGIGLVEDNAEHIEGRVNGQRIVLLTQFVKKTN